MLHDIFLLIISVFLLLFNVAMVQAYITSSNKYNDLINDYRRLKCVHNATKYLIEELQRNQHMKDQFNSTFKKSSDKIVCNDTIKDALKIAMIQSHPDNGGNKDDFIRFREAYNTYKK